MGYMKFPPLTEGKIMHFTHEIRKKRNDIIHLKIAHDLIFMRFLRILFMRYRQKAMTSLALMYSRAS